MSDLSSRIFNELLSPIALSQGEDEFMTSFFKTFPDLFEEQAQMGNSTRAKNNGQTVYNMKFQKISTEFIFTGSGLLEARVKLPKDEFVNLKQYVQNNFRATPFVKGAFGTLETTKIRDFNTEITFAKMLVFGCEMTIKRIK